LIDKVRKLDRYYIPTRYPNAWPALPPHKHYSKDDAEEALKTAVGVVEIVKRGLREVLKGTSVEDLIKPLEDLLRSIVEELRPTRILITGSLARKEFVRGLSDIDILVLVVVDYEVPSGERFMLASVGGVDVEVTVVSKYELEKALDEGREFYVDAVRYGVEVFP